jgi:hypothetical protein
MEWIGLIRKNKENEGRKSGRMEVEGMLLPSPALLGEQLNFGGKPIRGMVGRRQRHRSRPSPFSLLAPATFLILSKNGLA